MDMVYHQSASLTTIPKNLNSKLVAVVKTQVLPYLLQVALPKYKQFKIA